MTWFKVVSLVFGSGCLAEAVVELIFPKKFYGWVRRLCLAQRMPPGCLILVGYTLGLIVATGYAAIFHYRPYGWILVAVMALLSMKVAWMLCSWNSFRESTIQFLDSAGPNLRWYFWFAALFGGFFLWLGIAVY